MLKYLALIQKIKEHLQQDKKVKWKEAEQIVESLTGMHPLRKYSNKEIIEKYADIPDNIQIDEDRFYSFDSTFDLTFDRAGLWAEIDMSDAFIYSNAIYNIKVHLNAYTSYVQEVGIVASSADKYFADNQLNIDVNEIKTENEGKFLTSTLKFTLHGLERLTYYYIKPYTILPNENVNYYDTELVLTQPPTYVIAQPPTAQTSKKTQKNNKNVSVQSNVKQNIRINSQHRLQGDQITTSISKKTQTNTKNASTSSAIGYNIGVS